MIYLFALYLRNFCCARSNYSFANKLAISLCFFFPLFFSGCATVPFDTPTANITSTGPHGVTFGGQQAIASATVTLYAVGTSGYGTGSTLLATATAPTDSGGNYNFGNITCPYSNTPTYLLSTGGNAGGGANSKIVLAAASGPCGGLATATVNINEVTTVATAYAMAQFFTTNLAAGSDAFGGTAPGSGIYNQGLSYADFYTVPALVSLGSNVRSPALTTATSGTLTITRESAKLYHLANIIATCVNSASPSTPCTALFGYTNTASTPTDTLQAAVQIALYPWKNVASLYDLPSGQSPYVGLTAVPNDWTLAISYTSTALGLGINGTTTSQTSSNLDIDETGNIWFPTNSSVAHGLASFQPSTMAFTAPVATALQHPQYLTITRQGAIFGSDTATAQIVQSTGTVIAATGFTGPIRAGYGTASLDNLYFTGGGTASAFGSSLFVYNNAAVVAQGTYAAPPNDIASYTSAGLVDAATSGASTACRYESNVSANLIRTTGQQNVIISNSPAPCYAGGVAFNGYTSVVTTSNNQVCDYGENASLGIGISTPFCITPPLAINAPRALAMDGNFNLWVANSGNASISTFTDHQHATSSGGETSADYTATSTLQYIHNAAYGGTLVTPYGLAIDRSGNVWISNAGCVSTTGTACAPGPFVLSELIGAAAPVATPLAITNIVGTNLSRPTTNAITAPQQ